MTANIAALILLSLFGLAFTIIMEPLSLALISFGAIALFCGIAENLKPLKAFVTSAVIIVVLRFIFQSWTKDDNSEAFMMKMILFAPIALITPLIGFAGHLRLLRGKPEGAFIGGIARMILTWGGAIIFIIGLCHWVKPFR